MPGSGGGESGPVGSKDGCVVCVLCGGGGDVGERCGRGKEAVV